MYITCPLCQGREELENTEYNWDTGKNDKRKIPCWNCNNGKVWVEDQTEEGKKERKK